MSKKIILLFSIFLCATPLLHAQDVTVDEEIDDASPWIVRAVKWGFHLLTDPSSRLDTAYIYHTPLRWTGGLETTHISSTVDLHSDVKESPLPGSGTLASAEYGMDFSLQKRLYHKVGASFGYGGLSGGYGVEVGGRTRDRNSYFSLGLSGNSVGVQIQNYVIKEYIEKTGGPYGQNALSDYPGRLRDFAVDAYYVFNNRRFAYSAAYKGAKIQRRSVGSWMVSGRYLLGDLTVDERDKAFLEITDRLGRYTTNQVSLGGGYSFNWVLLHRDPTDWSKSKGLRNLTLNLTALPMASVYTHVDSYHFQEKGKEPFQTHFDGKLALALQAHAALGFCWDRFSVNVQAHYNRFGFDHATQTLRDQQRGLRYDVDSGARFQDLTAKVQFYVRF